MKHDKVIKNDLIVALKTLPILSEEIRLNIVLPTLENRAKKANKMYMIFIPQNQKLPYFPRIFRIFPSIRGVVRCRHK